MRLPSIGECRSLLASCPPEALGPLLEQFETDARSGVRALASTARRSIAADSTERTRQDRLMELQVALHAAGARTVAGVDEVGRGALAGPLTVAAVVLLPETRIERLDDSKRLTPQRRETVSALVRGKAVAFAIVHVSADEIDTVGIREAVRLGMDRAVGALGVAVDHVLVDGNDARLSLPCTPVVGGDSRCACIAAASVVAKVARDALMRALAPQYPAFLFDVNKGYGTLEHMEAIRPLGVTPLHRRSFAPCSQPPLF